jgi:outer membrane protein W
MRTYEYTEAGGLADGAELEQMPVTLVVKYAIGAGRIALVIGGGLVWSVNDEDEVRSLTVDDSLGYKVAVGLNIGLIQSLALSVEAQYEVSEADVMVAVDPWDPLSPQIETTLETDATIIRVAILYNF